MWSAGHRVFARLMEDPESGLVPGRLASAAERRVSVLLEGSLPLRRGRELLLYYDDLRMFVQQAAAVVEATPSGPSLRVELELLGAPTPAERRRMARISAEDAELYASIDGSDFGQVLDLSARGFSVATDASAEIGRAVEAILLHGEDDLSGAVAIRDVRELGDGRRRLGVVCVDGLLKFALASVNLSLQREQLRRAAESARHATPQWSVRPAPLSPPGCVRDEHGPEPHEESEKPLPARRLEVSFHSLLSFEQELLRSLSGHPVFVPTPERFAVGAPVELELDLRFSQHRVVLEARVTSAEVEPESGAPGVHLELRESGAALRNLLAEVAGVDRTPAGWLRPESSLSRQPRTARRVAAIVAYGGRSRPAHTRNLSVSGALLVADGDPVPIGACIRLTLVDPDRGDSAALGARVVRHVEHDGRVTALGVRFEVEPDRASPVTRFLDRIQQGAQPRQSGRLQGTLAAVGLPNLLQMLALCVDEGALRLQRGALQAELSFERGTLRGCRLGNARGLKALARVLEWEDGEFEFHPGAALEDSDGVRIPIENALLECTHQVDELHRLRCYPLPPNARFVKAGGDRAEPASPSQRQVLARIESGWTIRQILDHFPVYDTEIYRVIDGLLEERFVVLQG